MRKFFPLAALIATTLVFTGSTLAAPGDTAPAEGKPAREGTGVMRYDTNKDGFVDRAEWNAGQEARFKQLDTDKDGKLTKDELFARTPASGNNALPTDTQLRRQSAYFQRLDTDKDGFVSKAEFMAQADRNFARCDLNKDGRINTAECRQALRRRPADAARVDR
jgi:hypothetical protein